MSEHFFDFTREPAMFEEDGTMVAWCFHCCRWEAWRLIDGNVRRGRAPGKFVAVDDFGSPPLMD